MEKPETLRLSRISVRGVVQGVGFRPFVYQLAGKYSLAGWVCNTSEDVKIEVEGNRENIDRFMADLRDSAVFALKGKRRSPSRYAKRRDIAELVDQVHRQPVAEILLVASRRMVLECQHRDRVVPECVQCLQPRLFLCFVDDSLDYFLVPNRIEHELVEYKESQREGQRDDEQPVESSTHPATDWRVVIDLGLAFEALGREFEGPMGTIEFPRPSRTLASDPASEFEQVLDQGDGAAFATPTQIVLATWRREGPQLTDSRRSELLALVREQPANLEKVRDWLRRTDRGPDFEVLRPQLVAAQREGFEQRRKGTFRSRLPR